MEAIDIAVDREGKRVAILVPDDLYAIIKRRTRKDGTISPKFFASAFCEWDRVCKSRNAQEAHGRKE